MENVTIFCHENHGFLAFLAFPFLVINPDTPLVGSDKLSKIIGCWCDLCPNVDFAFRIMHVLEK